MLISIVILPSWVLGQTCPTGTDLLALIPNWRTSITLAELVGTVNQLCPFPGPAFEISSDSEDVSGNNSVCFDGVNFLVVFRSGSQIKGARVSLSGVVLDQQGIVVGNNAAAPPSCVFDGQNFLVVWVDDEVYGARIDANGAVLDPAPVPLSAGGNPRNRRLALARGTGLSLIAWRDQGDRIRFFRLTPDMTVLDAAAGVDIGGGFYPWAAFDGTNFLVVWHAWGNSLDVLGNRVALDGSVLDNTGFVISNEAGRQEHAAVAFNGTNYLVVWSDEQGGDAQGFSTSSARGRRVSPAGTVLDAGDLVFGDRHRGPEHVAVVSNGSEWLVTWMPDMSPAKFRLTDSLGLRVAGDGNPLDAAPVPIATAFAHQWGGRVGYGNHRFLAVWKGELGSCPGNCIVGRILEFAHGGGTPPSPPRAPRLTTKKGMTWQTVTSPTGQDLHDIWALADDDIYAVGETPELYRWDGLNWAMVTPVPNARKYGLWADSNEGVWMVGWCGDAVHWDGQAMSHTNCRGNIGMGIWGLGPGESLSVGVRGESHHNLFGLLDTGVSWDLWDLYGDPNTPSIYAVGEYGTLLVFDGQQWSPVPDVPGYQSLNGIWINDSGEIFAASDAGKILCRDGAAWTIENTGSTQDLYGVWGHPDGDIYTVGRGGVILRRENETWSAETSGTNLALLGVSGTQNSVWAVGEGGIILQKPIVPE